MFLGILLSLVFYCLCSVCVCSPCPFIVFCVDYITTLLLLHNTPCLFPMFVTLQPPSNPITIPTPYHHHRHSTSIITPIIKSHIHRSHFTTSTLSPHQPYISPHIRHSQLPITTATFFPSPPPPHPYPITKTHRPHLQQPQLQNRGGAFNEKNTQPRR